MNSKDRVAFWAKVNELVPEQEPGIKNLIATLQKNQADPLKAQKSFLRFFDFIANESNPNKQWSEKVWDLFDRLSEGDK
jgi:hypothetical protein